MKIAIVFLISAFLFGTAEAQRLAGNVQTSILPGGNVTLRVYDTTGNGFHLDSPCGDVEIHVATPNGTLLPNPPACGPGLTIVPPFGTFTYSWPPLDPTGAIWPDGEYWLRFRAIDPVTNQGFEELFNVRLGNAGAAISAPFDPQVGTTSPINVFGGPPNGFYWIFLARSSNQPIFYQGVQWALSADGLFFASLTNPVSVMANFGGPLDGQGSGTASLLVPPVAQLAYSAFVVQALLIDTAGSGAYEATNAAYRRILP